MALFLAICCFTPVSNLTPSRLQCLLFERYLFIPHLSAAWLLAQGFDALSLRLSLNAFASTVLRRVQLSGRLFLGTLTSVLALAFSWLSHERALDYADNERFWKHELQFNSLSTVAPTALASLPNAEQSPKAVLRLLSRCHSNATLRRDYPQGDACLLRALVVLRQHTPDNQPNTLRAIAEELKLLLSGNSAKVRRPPLTFSIGRFQLNLDAARTRLLLATRPGLIESELAIIYNRLDEPKPALDYARLAISQCSSCRWSAALALVYANHGDFPTARHTLDAVRTQLGEPELRPLEARLNEAEAANRIAQTATGAALVRARAERLSALTLYGQAYQVLLPEKDHFIDVPDVAIGFAQVAHFAGYDTEAKAVLYRHYSPEQAAAILREWKAKMPFVR
jgi:hypothetical protein